MNLYLWRIKELNSLQIGDIIFVKRKTIKIQILHIWEVNNLKLFVLEI